MTKIILSGCCGKMGTVISNLVKERGDCEIVAGVDKYDNGKCSFKVFPRFDDVSVQADVIIDFSNPDVLNDMLSFAKSTGTPCVIATTGYNDEQVNLIKEASREIAVFFTFNMSIGINLMTELAKKATQVLSDTFDIEIIEKHHNQKIDAPSGTAIMLANAVSSKLETPPRYEYDRHSKRTKREKAEIGNHSVRGGTIVGEHEIIFAGHDEILSIKHQAMSKEIFASGALNAAVFLSTKATGLYEMSDMLK